MVIQKNINKFSTVNILDTYLKIFYPKYVFSGIAEPNQNVQYIQKR